MGNVSYTLGGGKRQATEEKGQVEKSNRNWSSSSCRNWGDAVFSVKRQVSPKVLIVLTSRGKLNNLFSRGDWFCSESKAEEKGFIS